MMKTLSRLLFFLTLFLFSHAHGFDHSANLRHLQSTLHKTWQNTPADLPLHSRLFFKQALTSVESTGLRKLQQLGNDDVCEWDAQSTACVVSANGVLELLSIAKNPVADFLRHEWTCSFAQTQQECTNSKCQWAGQSGCFPSLKEFQEFHSADCLEAVDHIIDLREGNIRCNPMLTEDDCNASAECTWQNGQCSFDLWQYYHDIKTVNGLPEMFPEVRSARFTQLFDEINRATEAGVLATTEDLLTWDAPDFVCPPNVKQVVCNYVNAFTPFGLQDGYCSLTYNEESKLAGCQSDRFCRPTNAVDGALCTANDESFTASFQQALLEFAKSIQDEESRRFITLQTTCSFNTEENACDRSPNCVWLNTQGICSLDSAWIEREIASSIGYTRDPVCQYFRLPVDMECVSLKDPTTCAAETLCAYNTATEQCDIALVTGIFHALSVSGVEGAVRNAIDACNAAPTASSCAAVKFQNP